MQCFNKIDDTGTAQTKQQTSCCVQTNRVNEDVLDSDSMPLFGLMPWHLSPVQLFRQQLSNVRKQIGGSKCHGSVTIDIGNNNNCYPGKP